MNSTKTVDLHSRKKSQEGELIMVLLCKERNPQGAYNKLKPMKSGFVDLLEYLDISPIFNVTDLH